MLVLGALLLTGACGFQPVYGKWSATTATAQQLNQVQISNIPDRPGQVLRNLLIDRFYHEGRPDRTLYQLDIELASTEQKLGMLKDATETRALVDLRARYRLVDPGERVIRYAATSRAVISYNMLDAPYATVAAKDDAYRRALVQIADDITTRVALYFTRDPSVTPPQGVYQPRGAAPGRPAPGTPDPGIPDSGIPAPDANPALDTITGTSPDTLIPSPP